MGISWLWLLDSQLCILSNALPDLNMSEKVVIIAKMLHYTFATISARTIQSSVQVIEVRDDPEVASFSMNQRKASSLKLIFRTNLTNYMLKISKWGTLSFASYSKQDR